MQEGKASVKCRHLSSVVIHYQSAISQSPIRLSSNHLSSAKYNSVVANGIVSQCNTLKHVSLTGIAARRRKKEASTIFLPTEPSDKWLAPTTSVRMEEKRRENRQPHHVSLDA